MLKNYVLSVLFEELVKCDFQKKYKRTVLGVTWSILSPLLTLLVMREVLPSFSGETLNTTQHTCFVEIWCFHTSVNFSDKECSRSCVNVNIEML